MNKQIILFFDGECALCNYTIQWILKNEKTQHILFCSLNSEFAKQNIPEELKKTDSVILKKDEQFYTHFDTFIKIIPQLKWYCKIFYLIKLLPNYFRNSLYDFIAKNRKRWFGSVEECWLMKSEWKDRVIE